MITIEQAKELGWRKELHHVEWRNRDGSPVRYRVNGKPQTWKRDPNRVKVPLKHGLYGPYDYLTERDLETWSLTQEEALGIEKDEHEIERFYASHWTGRKPYAPILSKEDEPVEDEYAHHRENAKL